MSDWMLSERVAKLENEKQLLTFDKGFLVPPDVKVLILTTHPSLGGDVVVDPNAVEIIERQLKRAGMGHVKVIVLAGLAVAAALQRPDADGALVFADWLEGKGHDEAAQDLRATFGHRGREEKT